MDSWYMLTIIGRDRPMIMSNVTRALFEGGCNLGEASAIRLGGNFTIMLMVHHRGDTSLDAMLQPVAEEMGLRCNVEPIVGELHSHEEPDVCITVHGADRAGIVAQVTGILADAGLNILDLRSDVAGSPEEPVYVMQIEGVAQRGFDALKTALDSAELKGIEATLRHITTLVG